MNSLLENPFPILLVGILVTALASAVWTQQRTRPWLILAVVAIVLTIGGFMLERLVVSESERVESMIHQVAKQMESNRIPKVLDYIATSSPDLANQAESILRRVNVKSVSVKRNLTVSIAADGNTAVARFHAVARVSDRSGALGEQTVPRFITLYLVKERGEWKITDYQAEMPQEGMKRH